MSVAAVSLSSCEGPRPGFGRRIPALTLKTLHSGAPATSSQSIAVVVLFATTLFLSAFLLFVVEPIVAKTVLPTFGGAPMVWNTCVVFFQIVLLGGYGYAHVASEWTHESSWPPELRSFGSSLVAPAAIKGFSHQPLAGVTLASGSSAISDRRGRDR